VVVGLSHKTAPVVRGKLSIPEPQMESAILRLLPHSSCHPQHVQPARNLSPETEQGIQEVTQFLSEHSKLPLSWATPVYLVAPGCNYAPDASCSWVSLVLGEGQILAQVKQVHKLGQQYNGIKLVLNRLFKQAITAGKRVRTETSIGTGAVSISSAAVELAQMKGQNLAARVQSSVLEKCRGCWFNICWQKGCPDFNSESLANGRKNWRVSSRIQLQLYAISEMMAVMAKSDLVFTSTAATEPLIERSHLAVLEPNRPLMLVDISVPRNVHGNVQDIAVQAFNVDDLKAVVAQNESRRKMAMEAEGLLEEEVEAFDVWWRSLETVSTISCLRNKTIREQELEKLCLAWVLNSPKDIKK